MQPVPDPYRALGVPRGATEAEIKAAHRKLAKRYHPDGSGGDTKRFLSVQEAYRVLSDPLLRRDWDAKHAGPMRATQPAPAKSRPARSTRRPASSTRARTAAPPDEQEAGTGQPRPEGEQAQPASARPRSSRAYTWSASEVPWWEEGTAAREKKRAQTRRRRSAAAAAGTNTGTGDDPTPEPDHAETPHDFDVYNRSSGAAWSMAARAYFRRGDQDLPSRGSFQYQGTQVLTAARARAAAEAEARQQAARAAREQQPAPPRQSANTPPPQPAYAYASASAGVARDPVSVGRAREQFLKRLRAQHWPNLKERLLYALVAWLPIAVLIAYGGTVGTGCDRGALGCPPQVELVQAGLIGLTLLAFVLLPKVAYFGALGTLGMLLALAASVTVIAFLEAPLPLSIELVAAVGGVMLVGYLASAGIAAARGGPWRVGQR